MIKYLLLSVIVYLMYRGMRPKNEIGPAQEPEDEGYADYEELG